MSARILVVEDHPLNFTLFRHILEHRGHRIDGATTVEEACASLDAWRPDLVLLDIQIPGGGGEVVLAHIRASSHLADVPVIALTALAMDGDRERLLAAGFDGYLSKPIDTLAFGPTVEAFIKVSRES